MRPRTRDLVVGLTAVALAGCSQSIQPPADGRGSSGPGVEVNVAALNLVGVGDVIWDLEVVNGQEPAETVWRQRVTSSQYGDGAGSASYIGPCDASDGVADNTVRVWVVGLYAGPVGVADAGAFNAGSTDGVGAVAATSLAFVNPTAGGPLTQVFTCRENADVFVRFDVTLMRPAQQGFFDIAVNFNDVFCSAKYDCCRSDADGACVGDLELLFDAGGARARTHVLAFACSAGAGAGVETALYMDALELDCDVNSDATAFVADVTIAPSPATAGNQCTPGALSACPAITEAPGVDADDYLFQVAVYRGEEALQSGGASANKVYWNIALGVKAPIAGCTLRTRATADDHAKADDGLQGGLLAAGQVYPVVNWDVDLGTCGAEPLTFGDPNASVGVGYTSTSDAAQTFGYAYGATVPAGAVCLPGCDNGGTCAAPGQCDCPFGFTGDHCEVDLNCTGTICGFAFADLLNADKNTAFESDIVQVLGIASVPVNVTLGYWQGELRVCDDPTCANDPPYTTSGTITPGQYLQVRLQTTDACGEDATVQVNVGDAAAAWVVRTNTDEPCATPGVTASMPTPPGPGRPDVDVEMRGPIAYISSSNTPTIAVDVSDPSQPVTVASRSFSQASGKTLALGDFLYVPSRCALTIVDISDPTQMPTVWAANFPVGYAHEINASPDTPGFIAWGGVNTGCLDDPTGGNSFILDIADQGAPAAPVTIHTQHVGNSNHGGVAHYRKGHFYYNNRTPYSDDRLTVKHLASNVQVAFASFSLQDAADLEFAGDYLYIAAPFWDYGLARYVGGPLRVVDVSDVDNGNIPVVWDASHVTDPTVAGLLALGAWEAEIVGNTLYVSFGTAIAWFDISGANAAAPVLVNFVDGHPTMDLTAFEVYGNHAIFPEAIIKLR